MQSVEKVIGATSLQAAYALLRLEVEVLLLSPE
jgi:hypothetical protein